LATALPFANRKQPNDRILPARNDDLLAPARFLNQPGKAGLGFVNADGLS
jgi:hypothetical protein